MAFIIDIYQISELLGSRRQFKILTYPFLMFCWFWLKTEHAMRHKRRTVALNDNTSQQSLDPGRVSLQRRKKRRRKESPQWFMLQSIQQSKAQRNSLPYRKESRCQRSLNYSLFYWWDNRSEWDSSCWLELTCRWVSAAPRAHVQK